MQALGGVFGNGQASPDGKSIAEIVRELRARKLHALAVEIAAWHHVKLSEMLQRSMELPHVRARWHLWAVCYVLIPSSTELGRIFGRDHTTILGGVRRHRELTSAAQLELPFANGQKR